MSLTLFLLPHQSGSHHTWQSFCRPIKSNWRAIRLAHPDLIASPTGSLPHVLLYQLGHAAPLPQSRAQPDDLRITRDQIALARVAGQALHVFGVIDRSSPIGSIRLLEDIIGATALQPIIVHGLSWHATEREKAVVKNDLLAYPVIHSVTIWPAESLHTRRGATDYIETFFKSGDTLVGLGAVHYPDHLGFMPDIFYENSGYRVPTFQFPIDSNHRFDTSQFRVISNDLKYTHYYFGADSLMSTTIISTIDDLISQLKGDTPTYVFLDDRLRRDSEKLMGHIQDLSGETDIYYLDPFSASHHILLTNRKA